MAAREADHILNIAAREATVWRREMHRQPGLAFQEYFAHRLVAEKLTECGIPFRVLAKTGIVGIIEGRTNNLGRTIGLRADMDALAIEENKTGKPWSSINPGIMHACGHDGHTAILLGAAKYLQENRDFDGRVLVIFQPAEENGSFGAKTMIDDGLFSGDLRCDEVYALHNSPGFRLGTAFTRAGPMMASSDHFILNIKGKGGHAVGVKAGPVIPAAKIVVRNDLLGQALNNVLIATSSCRSGGDSFGVVSDTAEVRGTVRAFTTYDRVKAEAGLRTLWCQAAEECGVIVDVNYIRGYDPTVNHPALTEKSVSCLRQVFRSANVRTDITPAPYSDDFGALSQVVPGCYVTLGQATDDPASPCNQPLHSSGYDFNDDLITPGIKYFVDLVRNPKPV